MEATIERLRKEKIESEGDYVQEGKEAGLEWAKSAHYDELQFVQNWKPQPGDDPTRLNSDNLEGLEEHIQSIIEYDSLMDFDICGKANEYIDKFVEGWIEGVKGFWNEVENKI